MASGGGRRDEEMNKRVVFSTATPSFKELQRFTMLNRLSYVLSNNEVALLASA